jgi:hypothetical protein
VVNLLGGDGYLFARERPTALTIWHPDVVNGSHPPHLFWRAKQTWSESLPMSPSSTDVRPQLLGQIAGPFSLPLGRNMLGFTYCTMQASFPSLIYHAGSLPVRVVAAD